MLLVVYVVLCGSEKLMKYLFDLFVFKIYLALMTGALKNVRIFLVIIILIYIIFFYHSPGTVQRKLQLLDYGRDKSNI